MADALRAQVAELRTLTVQALVVGGDNDGIAILAPAVTRGTGTPAGESNTITVRANTTVTINAGTLPVRLTVKKVTPAGVEIEAPTLSEPLLIEGGYKPGTSVVAQTPGLLRYLECREVALESVLGLIADQTGANLSASAETAAEKVSIFLRNVSVEVAVEEICRTRNLWFRRDEGSGIIRVTSMSEYERSLSTFREESIESFTLLYPNVFEVAAVIYGLYPERVSIFLGEEGSQEENSDISRRFERLSILSNGSNSGLLRNSPGASFSGSYGGSYGGGGFGSAYGGRNSLMLNTGDNLIDLRTRKSYSNLTADDAKQVQTLIQGVDSNSVENVLETYRDKSANIFVTASRRNNILMVRTGDPLVMAEIRNLIKRLDVPTPMVLLEVKVLQLTLDNLFTSSFEYELHKTYNRNSSTPTETKAGFPGFEPLTDIMPNPDAFSFKVLSDNLNVRIKLLEESGHIKTLATPTLLTANNEVSRLFIGEERPIIQNVSGDVVVNRDNVVVSPNVSMEYVPVGNMLLITPNINADRTVTLRLMQENAKIKPGDATIPLYTDSSKGWIDFAIDVVSTRSIAGTFIAADGMTVAAGGLIEEDEERRESKIPFLGSIPYLGWLFRSTKKVKSRSELIVLIKPHVISTPQEGHEISQRVLEGLSVHPARDGRSSMGIYKDDAQPPEQTQSQE